MFVYVTLVWCCNCLKILWSSFSDYVRVTVLILWYWWTWTWVLQCPSQFKLIFFWVLVRIVVELLVVSVEVTRFCPVWSWRLTDESFSVCLFDFFFFLAPDYRTIKQATTSSRFSHLIITVIILYRDLYSMPPVKHEWKGT